jgi:hypothetical protein
MAGNHVRLSVLICNIDRDIILILRYGLYQKTYFPLSVNLVDKKLILSVYFQETKVISVLILCAIFMSSS